MQSFTLLGYMSCYKIAFFNVITFNNSNLAIASHATKKQFYLFFVLKFEWVDRKMGFVFLISYLSANWTTRRYYRVSTKLQILMYITSISDLCSLIDF